MGLAGNSILKQLVKDGDMGATSITSPAFNIQDMSLVGLQLVWSGTPTGTFDVQVSNDANLSGTGDWTSVTPAPGAPAGSASSDFVNLVDLAAAYVRVVYTKTSGTTLTDKLQIWAMGKAL